MIRLHTTFFIQLVYKDYQPFDRRVFFSMNSSINVHISVIFGPTTFSPKSPLIVLTQRQNRKHRRLSQLKTIEGLICNKVETQYKFISVYCLFYNLYCHRSYIQQVCAILFWVRNNCKRCDEQWRRP